MKEIGLAMGNCNPSRSRKSGNKRKTRRGTKETAVRRLTTKRETKQTKNKNHLKGGTKKRHKKRNPQEKVKKAARYPRGGGVELGGTKSDQMRQNSSFQLPTLDKRTLKNQKLRSRERQNLKQEKSRQKEGLGEGEKTGGVGLRGRQPAPAKTWKKKGKKLKACLEDK